MSVAKTGLARLPRIFAKCKETGDTEAANLMLTLYWLVRMVRAKIVIELGIRHGNATRTLLAGAEDTGGMVISYDIDGDKNAIRRQFAPMWMPEFDPLWTCVKSDTVIAGRLWDKQLVDLIYMNSLRTYEHCKDNIAAWCDHVAVGGCMVFPGYWGQFDGHGIKRAVDQFVDAFRPTGWELETHDAVENDAGLAILWRKA
jgi:methyltransferase family protein